MATHRRPVRELQGIISPHRASLIRKALNDLAAAIISGKGLEKAQRAYAGVMVGMLGLADIMGRNRVALVTEGKAARLQADATDALPYVPFLDAIDALLERRPTLLEIQPGETTDVAMGRLYKAKGFSLAKAATEKIMRAAQGIIAQVAKGKIPQQTAEQQITRLQKNFTPAYARVVLRNNLNTAYHDGIFRQMADPEAADVLSALMFAAVGGKLGDGDTSEVCKKCHGTIAPASHPVWDRRRPPLHHNCFLPGTRVEALVRWASRATYRGQAVEIETGDGRRLRVTVNHPVLTSEGWAPAGSLRKGDDVVCYGSPVEPLDDHSGPTLRGAHHGQEAPALVEDVFDALPGKAMTLAAGRGLEPHDLHGDAAFIEGEVHVVRADGVLPAGREPTGRHEHGQVSFQLPAGCTHDARESEGAADLLLLRDRASAGGLPGGGALRPDSVGPTLLDPAPLEPLRIGPSSAPDSVLVQHRDHSGSWHAVFGRDGWDSGALPVHANDGRSVASGSSSVGGSWLDAGLSEPSTDNGLADAALARDLVLRGAGLVSTRKVVSVRHFDFAGHVYDLGSESGLIVSEGIVTSNCRSGLDFVTKDEWDGRVRIPNNGIAERLVTPGFGRGGGL